MKHKFILIIGIIIVLASVIWGGILLYKDYQIKHAIVIIELKDNLNTDFLSEVKVSDFINNINGKIIDDYKIDTTKVGEKTIYFEYINDDNIKLKKSYNINIVDNTPPIIWLGNSYSLAVGSNVNLLNKIMCADDYDSEPECVIIGEYDMDNVGIYPLTFKATDGSGNTTTQEFNLNIYKPDSNSNSSNNNNYSKTLFSDVYKNYKNNQTEIGLDISEWQGDVDFEKLKEAGVEFVIIRVGGTKGINGEYFLDKKFIQNIENANKYEIPAGIYFYSYANSEDSAIKDAKWILKQIKGYKIDLPIAFDWENWSFYNDFKLSLFGLTNMANKFLDVFKTSGYEGMLYSSKSYLEEVWLKTNYPIWLAHYTSKTNYTGAYSYWQMCSDGKVDGIYGDVDINIRYK